MKLSVIIVNYNVRLYAEQCLRSVLAAVEGMDAEIFVVDNHSHDGSVDYLRERFPEIHLIDSLHNLGFSRANNLAISQSSGEYVLLLNPDTMVGEQVLKQSVAFMDQHAEAGGVGVQMLSAVGEKAPESRRGLPTPMTAFYKVTGLCRRFPASRRFGRYYMGFLPWDKAVQIEVVSGAFFLLRRAAIGQVGHLDEDFFMYGEDIDLSARLLEGGWQNWYLPLQILHYKGESTQKSSFRYVHVFYDAMLIFFRKHNSHLSFLVTFPVKLAIYAKAALALLQMQSERLRKSLGFSWGQNGLPPAFVFIGQADMLAECRQLAVKHGLSVLGEVEGNHGTLPDGHLGCSLSLPDNCRCYMVYDVQAYPYQDILRIFSSQPIFNVGIGTYDRRSGVLLTAEETYY